MFINFDILKRWLGMIGTRMVIGPFTAPGAVGVTAASQTNLDCRYSFPVTAAATSFVAPRAGFIVGVSGQLTAAVTGAAITVNPTVNGTEVALAATIAADTASGYGTAARGVYTFEAGDVIGVSYTTLLTTNTPALVASVEIEC